MENNIKSKKNKTPKVSIVIVNFNGIKHLKKCLKSIRNQSYRNIEIIIIDSYTTEESEAYLKQQKDIKYYLYKENLGYGKGNNIGVHTASGEFVFIINNDTALFKKTIDNLVSAFEDHTILIPLQIINKGKIKVEVAGNSIDPFGYPYGFKDLCTSNKLFYADGAAIFLRKNDFVNIGGFDEELFMFQEDIDFSWRALLYDYRLKQVLKAKLHHYSGGSIQGGTAVDKNYKLSYFRRYYNDRNVIANIIKNFTLPTICITLPILTTFHLLEIILFSLKGDFRVAKLYIKAYKWIFANLHILSLKRKVVQSRRIKGDVFILKKTTLGYSKLTAMLRLGGIPKFN